MQVVGLTAATAFPVVVADAAWWFIAKWTAAVAAVAVANGIGVAKVWRVFKSAKLIALLASLENDDLAPARAHIGQRLAADRQRDRCDGPHQSMHAID